MSGYCSAHQGHETDCLQCGVQCKSCFGTGLRSVSSPDGTENYLGPGPCPECHGLGVTYPTVTSTEETL